MGRSFIDLAIEYRNIFGENPPVLATLSEEDEEYLKMLEKAIEDEQPLTRDKLAEVFMTNEDVVY